MATNYNPSNVSITVNGKPVETASFFSAPIKPVTAPVYVNGELVLYTEVDASAHRALAKLTGTPLIERTKHPMRFHRP